MLNRSEALLTILRVCHSFQVNSRHQTLVLLNLCPVNKGQLPEKLRNQVLFQALPTQDIGKDPQMLAKISKLREVITLKKLCRIQCYVLQ